MTTPFRPEIHLPGVDVPLSTVVLGTMSMGDTADSPASEALFEAAIDAGITSIDCANGYARGMTEALIAPFVARHRERIVLATKAGMPHPDADGRPPLSREALRASVEGSLRRLGVEAIDLFYLHQPDRQTPIRETMETVAELHAEGKIRALGVSNYAAWQALEITHIARELGTVRPVIGQNVYNLVARRIEDEWVEFAQSYDVTTMTYNPLAGGLLVRAPEDGATPARFAEGSSLAAMYRARYLTPELLAAVQQLAGVAEGAGLTMPQLGMRWVISQPGTGAVLVGGDQVEHLHQNLAAIAAGPLSADILEECARITNPLKGPMPAYNR